METVEKDRIREEIRNSYGRIATQQLSSCCSPAIGNASPQSGCCASESTANIASLLGYSEIEVAQAPDGSNLGLGCGNPQGIARLKEGEVVLDLGSGAGFDSFLAAAQVGLSGKVIGVDMTPEMIYRSRENARKGNYPQVEFRHGEIESLPVSDSSVDVIISNCVINLSPDKPRVLREAFRVLKPGGRLAISDILACIPLPNEIRNSPSLICGCVGGAVTIEEFTSNLHEAGFEDIHILPKAESKQFIKEWVPGTRAEDLIVSATIQASKPTAA
jgi:SAM-dependent methyltransferase